MDMAESIYGRCPICVRNMFRLICDFTCSPKQNQFVRVIKSAKENDMEYVVESQVILRSVFWLLHSNFLKKINLNIQKTYRKSNRRVTCLLLNSYKLNNKIAL